MKKFEELEKFQKEVSCQESPKMTGASVAKDSTEMGASQESDAVHIVHPCSRDILFKMYTVDNESIPTGGALQEDVCIYR
jgi:hypothetical protein